MFSFDIKVLVVDDMLTMRKIVSKTLKDAGFKDVTEAADGQKAWETLTTAATPFGLIFSDWNMPNMTGLDFLKKVRGDPKYANIPFLLVTAEAELNQVSEAVQVGVDGYVVKPFSQATLMEKLEQVYKKRGGK